MISGQPRPDSARITIREINDTKPFATLADDVRAGLLRMPKMLKPKYFYDEYGSQLFDQICDTPEYYPTRTEETLLRSVAGDIIEHVRPHSILELGSGASRKTTHLLNACAAQQCYSKYLPFDVCGEMMLSAGQSLACRYDWLEVEALIGDYCRDLRYLPRDEGPRLVAFLGGTIGNFYDHEASTFLRNVRASMDRNDFLLLGADRVKDVGVLEAAYNDKQGYTAAFNLNVLDVINRELDGEFNLHNFEHRALFNEDHSRIEMHLRAVKTHNVRIGKLNLDIAFEADESILTEISRKFTEHALIGMLERADLRVDRHFEADDRYYSLLLARPA